MFDRLLRQNHLQCFHCLFSGLGEKAESWDSFHVEDALTGTLLSAGFVSDQKMQIEDLKKTSSIQSHELKIEDWICFFPSLQSSIQPPGLKKFFSQPSIFNFQKKIFPSLQSSIFKRSFFPCLQSSIFNPASWIEEVFSQPSIFNFHKKFSSPPSMFNLQSSLLDWRSFFPAFNLQFSKEVFSQPSIFNLQSSLLDWRSFFPAFNLQFSKEVFSQPSIFNLQSSLLDWRSFFPAFNLQFSQDVFSQPSIFNLQWGWIEEVFSQPSIFNFQKKFFSQPSIFNFQKTFFPSLQSSIFNPASWIEEVFS